MNAPIRILLAATAALATPTLAQQPPLVAPAELIKPLGTDWLTYAGDNTNQRYSRLTAINRDTVKNLTLAWVARMNTQVRGTQGTNPASFATIVGGEGKGDFPIMPAQIKGSVLERDGILYMTSPNHAWAVDGRDGRELWHYHWRTRGGLNLSSRGAALWNDSLFIETADNYLVSLDARTGRENWHVQTADLNQQYFTTRSPIVIGDQVMVGSGNDLDMPGMMQAYDARTGKLNWRFYTTPQNPGDPGLETWPNLEAARHGGGDPWLPGAYDPETNLYIFGTGNPSPAYTPAARRGDNLFTCSVVALDVRTGKLAWYYQTSPHDTHDWDSSQPPVIYDGVIDGQPRKLVSVANRNGHFFTLDRVTGKHIVTSKFGKATNWTKGLRPSGQPDRNPDKDAHVAGVLVSPLEDGVANWQMPAFNPELGLFFSVENNGFQILYLTDPDPRGSMGLGGKRFYVIGHESIALQAIDYRTGKYVWRHEWPHGGGNVSSLLATAGGLLFSADGHGNLVALDAKDGKLLWHTRIGTISNMPETFEIDGRQYLLVAVGDTLYSFVLY